MDDVSDTVLESLDLCRLHILLGIAWLSLTLSLQAVAYSAINLLQHTVLIMSDSSTCKHRDKSCIHMEKKLQAKKARLPKNMLEIITVQKKTFYILQPVFCSSLRKAFCVTQLNRTEQILRQEMRRDYVYFRLLRNPYKSDTKHSIAFRQQLIH